MNYVEMTTSDNFFVRQDVTGFFTMLQGARARARDGAVRGACGVGRGFRPGRRVCGGAGRGLARWGGARACEVWRGEGWGGDSSRGAGVGIRTPGAGWDGIRDPARGGVEIRSRARGGNFLG